MYLYEQILNEHRQRVERGVRNYERLRVRAERAAKPAVSEPNSREAEDVEGRLSTESDDQSSRSNLRVGTSPPS